MSSEREAMRRLFELSESYDERDGAILVAALFKATDIRQFAFIAELVLKKWNSILNSSLERDIEHCSREWIAWLMLTVNGYRFKSVEPLLESFLADKSEFCLSASRYCIDKHIYIDEAIAVVMRLESELKNEQISLDSIYIGHLEEMLLIVG